MSTDSHATATAVDVPLNATVVAGGDHVSTTVDDEVVVLHLPTSTYHGLNGVGAHVWAQLSDERPASVRALIDSVAEAYDVDASVCASDVRSFLADLVGLELLTVVSEGDGEDASASDAGADRA
jgi:hypothetical protein